MSPTARTFTLALSLLVATTAVSCEPRGTEAGDAGADASTDAGPDTGADGGDDAGMDAGTDGGVDGGTDAGTDGGIDAGTDGGTSGDCGGVPGLTCPTGQTCDVTVGCQVSDATGTCVPTPTVCPGIYVPVCGCDGATYPNDCERVVAGAALDHAGVCP